MDGTGRLGATAFSSTAIREAAYVRIQEEICFWNRYHNELSLIFRLPPELLVKVFKYNVSSSLDCIRVSRVCSHWRRVALECPSLWSHIPFHRPKWAKEMLARSEMAPLTIMLIFSSSSRSPELLRVPCKAASAVKATVSQLSRIKELALYQGNLGHDRFMELLSPLDSPAPVLESLDISFLKFARDNKVPNYLFSGEAPRLSRLRLVGGDLNWQALPFTNLRSLEVRSTFAPPPEHIIFTLSNMPLLESFECEFHRATTHCTSTQCTVLVNLPRLVNLAIESDLPACAFLLDHITYPTTTYVEVRCKIKVMKDRRLNTVSVSLTQGLANDVIRRAQKTIHSLKVQQYAIILETCPETLEDAAQKNRCRSQLYFEFYPPKPPVVEIMTDIIQVLPSLAQTEILDVDVVSLPKAIWMNHFRGLSRLNTLRVGADCAGFLEVFSDSSLAMPGQSGHAAHFAFEALCELTLADWYFDEYCNFPDDGPWKSCYASLKDCLKARQEAGLTLELLMLENCNNVERYSVAPLRRYVKNLWRDGCTLYNSDDEEADG